MIVATLYCLYLTRWCVSSNETKSGNVSSSPTNPETDDHHITKLLEDYVLAANFDQRTNAATALNKQNSEEDIIQKPHDSDMTRISHDHFDDGLADVTGPGGPGSSNDRLAVWAPQASLATANSVLAVGFISFLILLATLQNNLYNMMRPAVAMPVQSTSLLGGITQALGRRRRK